MTLSVGTRLGSYEVLSALGAGGMGEVYRAHDTKLGRDVAIKVLPAFFANDPGRLARFAREARLLASVNHPHIATIHGLEEAEGVRALVMELVDGPTLAERLAQDSERNLKAGLSLAEAVRIGGQIAEALEAAHEKGVIHRDLKPANIKLSHDGNVKVLDFGLAKVFSTESAGSDLSQLPTVTASALQAGAIVGTPAYMSPEQARGQAIDKRTDIWAFGCVLYEMLTGRRVFPGATISDTIAGILEHQPEWGTLPADTPAAIRQLLRRCLDKDPKHRLHDIADARIEIDDVRSGVAPHGPVAPERATSRRPVAWAWALALTTLIAAATAVWAVHSAPATREVRLEINTPPSRDTSLAISPDGLKLVFAARSGGQAQLWLRSLDSSSARPLPGTERASNPFWSPDGRSVGFYADGKLKRMDIDGGAVQTLSSEAGVPLGGTWNRDGTILFTNSPGGPILRTSAGGGEHVAATRIGLPQQRGHHFPLFLPDGRHFLFFVTGSPEAHGVYIGHLNELNSTRVFDADGPAVYAASGHLLFVRDGKLMAQAFDPDRLKVSGDPFQIAEQVTGGTQLSASAAGPIVYRTPSADSGQRQLVWVNRSGRETAKVVYPDGAALGPSLSRDGRRIAVYRFRDGNMDIWSYETSRRAWDRLTFDPGDDIYPLWSRDGTSIIFGALRKGRLDLYRKPVGAPDKSEDLLLSTPEPKFPMDWSADGRFLLFDSSGPKRGSDIWALPLEGDRKPFEVVQTDFNEGLGQFSPDGKWIAYQSNKTGRVEIYLRPFPGPGGDLRASTEGGAQARWNPNGKELFYIGADDRLMAVPVRFSSDDKTVECGTAVGLFATTVGSTATLVYRQQYMVSPDGQSFVMNSVLGDAIASPIAVILNWKPNR